MWNILVLAAVLFAGANVAFGQQAKQETADAELKAAEPHFAARSSAAPDTEAEGKRQPSVTDTKLASGSDESSPSAPVSKVRNLRPVDYVRPAAEKRFSNYLHEVAGPFALIRYAATAGLLNLRNTPKEWGNKPDGYARRFGNVAAKNVMRATTTYALDEALKVDSSFYLSRDRSVAARLRNSIFSAVTARNRRGNRVIGIPRLAGSFVSEVVPSVAWYPGRYDQDHGLKGGAISIGISAGVNLLREFVLKR